MNIPRKVVVTQKFFDQAAIDFLHENNVEVEIPKLPNGKTERQLNPNDIANLLDGAGGWIVGHPQITREVLERVPDLAIVSRRGVGYEKVDTQAAADLGKVVTIAAGGNDASVADQVIGMMISLGRRFREAQNAMLRDEWSILVGTDLYQKTVGIIGLGRIGRSLAKRLTGFETETLVHTPNLTESDQTALRLIESDLDTIFSEADYITIHAPLNAQTRHLVNALRLQQMKPTSFLINTARGGLVDDRALLEALKSGGIAGAGLDVYESESNPELKPVTEELIALDNVIAAPHAGASTQEGLARTNMIAAICALNVIDGISLPEECVIVDGRNL